MTPLRLRIVGLALLLLVALACYLAGVTVLAELFVAGLILEFCFWSALLFSDWKGLKRASAERSRS